MGDRPAQDGRPSGWAANRAPTVLVEDTVALSQLDVGQMLLIILGEQRRALGIDGDEVQPVTRLGMFGGTQRVGAGRADRRGGQSLRHIGVPRGPLGTVGVVGGHLPTVQRIVHGRVEFERVVGVQAVVDHLRHLREVLRVGFLLHQRRHHQDVVRRQAHGLRGVQQTGLRVLPGAGADQRCQDAFGRGRGIDVEGPRCDEALDPAMVLTQLVDRLNGPRRHRQRHGTAVGRGRAEVVHRDAVPVTVEVHAGGARNQREDAGIQLVGLHVGGVVELTALRDDQQPHPVARVGEPRDGVGRRDFGANAIKAGLDRVDRAVAVRGADERPDRLDHLLVL